MIAGGRDMGSGLGAVQWVDDGGRLRGWWEWAEESSQAEALSGWSHELQRPHGQEEAWKAEAISLSTTETHLQEEKVTFPIADRVDL